MFSLPLLSRAHPIDNHLLFVLTTVTFDGMPTLTLLCGQGTNFFHGVLGLATTAVGCSTMLYLVLTRRRNTETNVAMYATTGETSATVCFFLAYLRPTFLSI